MKLKKLTAAALSFVMMLGINTAPAFAATSKSASLTPGSWTGTATFTCTLA